MIFPRLSEDEPPPWNVHRLNRPCRSCGADEWRMSNMVERVKGMICRKCGQIGDEKRRKKISTKRRKHRVCLSDAQQRNSAKWRVAGLAANIGDVLQTHGTHLHEQELFALRLSKEHMEKALATWSQD